MRRSPPSRSRGRVLTPTLALLAVVLLAVVAVGSAPTAAHAQADGDCQITAEPDPDCEPPPPEPPPPPDIPIPCTLFPNNPYGPYCGILGTYFDPNSPCTPFYCGGPFVIPIEVPAVVDHEGITNNLVEAIRVRENRPNQLTESELTTVAGIPASMATVEQATIGYTLDALRNFSAFRGFGTGDPNDTLTAWPLYLSDINQGYQRVNATRVLLTAVEGAVNVGQTVEDFLVNNFTLINSTGLSSDDVRTMYRAVPLEARVDAAHVRVLNGAINSDDRLQLAGIEAAQIPAADRLGIREIDLRNYIFFGNIWKENDVAWERKSVRTLPNNLGYKFEARAVYGSGRYMAQIVIGARVQQRIANAGCGGPNTLCIDIDEATVVRDVAQLNNARPTYGAEVLTIYCRRVYNTAC